MKIYEKHFEGVGVLKKIAKYTNVPFPQEKKKKINKNT